MAATVKRLEALAPRIEELASIAGTVGVSLGVLHHNEVIHTANYGYRDLEKKFPPDQETIYPMCSLTKAMVAAGVSMLVEEGKLEWDKPIKNYLQDFRTQNKTLQNGVTLTDLLSHRTGLQSTNYWLESQNNVIFSEEDSMKVINHLQLGKSFRG
jgi:CubicO group peptidase (beta-lactamase class C family)